MSIKADKWIRRMAGQGMIEPFELSQVRANGYGSIVSYGASSYGYTNINSTIVDPKAFYPKSFVDFEGDCCVVNVTPLEGEWEGHVTIEFSDTTTLPLKIYANEGVAQMLFLGTD
jgi:dCTP deaminase